MDASAYLVNANGLVIITSAMFAIAQYADVSHRSSVNKKIDSADAYLKNPKHLEKSEKLKKMYDNIKNRARLRASKQIICLFIMLLVFATLEVGILICSVTTWEKNAFALMGVSLVGIGIWLGINMVRMGKERSELNKEVASFNQVCEIAQQIEPIAKL